MDGTQYVVRKQIDNKSELGISGRDGYGCHDPDALMIPAIRVSVA
jgi:hypothetical protein